MRILIADDEAIIRMGLRAMLKEMGHEVVGAARSGAEAIRLAHDLQPEMVILDIKMPEVDGLAAAQRIAAERPVPILILTAYSDRDLVDRAANLAVQGYLVKPVREVELAAALALAQSTFQEWQALQQEAAGLQEALETRDLVDRAKKRLIESKGLPEREAFLYLQRRSREQRRTLRAVAEEVLGKRR